MKLYDFDGMFDEKLSEYIARNSSKYKENEWEDIIPELYRRFGDTPIKSLGKSPKEYYAEMDDAELIKRLKSHLKHGVPVSEFLCAAIESRNAAEQLLPLLDGTQDEVEYGMTLIGADPVAIDKYLDMLVSSSDKDMKDRCADFIKENADLVLKKAVAYYNGGTDKEYMLEIMSRAIQRSDEVFSILVNEFLSDPDEVPMHASYLAAYGDVKALPYLLDKIDEEDISFIEYQELKFAIEALGGEYTKERDFSDDPYFKLIKQKP